MLYPARTTIPTKNNMANLDKNYVVRTVFTTNAAIDTNNSIGVHVNGN